MRSWIQAAHPGTVTVAIDLFEALDSTTPLDAQLQALTAYVANLTSAPAWQNGYHVIGHSQGGLLMRALIQNSDHHRVHQFITLAGAVNGIYGVPKWLRGVIGNFTLPRMTSFMYSALAQKSLSFANYWHDAADNKRYLRDNVFLPRLNNEVRRVLWGGARCAARHETPKNEKMMIGNTLELPAEHEDASNCSLGGHL